MGQNSRFGTNRMRKNTLTLCMLRNFHDFCRLLNCLKINFFFRKFLRITIRAANSLGPGQVRPLSDLIWIQTACKGYQQMTLVGKELNSHAELEV